jgi:6-phosphofructokinase
VQIDKCFGFDTAVEQAQEALLAAKVEASSAYRGIGVVKLMGRSSGFIAMQASLASGLLTPWFLHLPAHDSRHPRHKVFSDEVPASVLTLLVKLGLASARGAAAVSVQL